MIDLRNKRAVIFGLPDSGKSMLAKSIIQSQPSHVVYDPMGEYDGWNNYVPEDRHSKIELDEFVSKYVIPRRPKLFVLDEANKYVEPKPSRIPRALADLNDFSAHSDIAWMMIARRPAQFHTDIVELAHYVFAFGLPGKNDRALFDSYIKGLGDVVAQLKPHHFVVLENGQNYYVHAPVSVSGINDPKNNRMGVNRKSLTTTKNRLR